MAVGFVIFVNAVTMGVEADFGVSHPMPFLVLEHLFTAIFFLELMCHWCVVGPRGYFADHMNWLDFSLVLISVVDVWIITPIGIDADLRMMSLFRMLRLIRLARLLRLLRMFKELTLLVNGFVASVRTLFWALVFLSIMVYIFSIFARQTIGAGEYVFNDDVTLGDDKRLFGSVDKTMLTLFVCLTEGCGMDVIHPTVLESPALIIFWATFVFFTTYGLLNLIVGCFCENAMKLANENEKEILENRDQQRMHILRHMKDAFNSMDKDHTGSISKKEFNKGIMGNRIVMNALVQLGLDTEQNLFEVLDSDNQGVITFEQFFDGASLIMKGQETAKAKDIVCTQLTTKTIQRKVKNMDISIKVLKKDMRRMETKMDGMSAKLNVLVTALCGEDGECMTTMNNCRGAIAMNHTEEHILDNPIKPPGLHQQQLAFPAAPSMNGRAECQADPSLPLQDSVAQVQEVVDQTRVVENDGENGQDEETCGNHKCLAQVPFLRK
eukprot:gnl/MRDRNA2_/MRDRNA2_81738_c0_seq1.p1 gnl/MRDRNA2_/MRDRNA2_81738_c0~~gnl/MRDRNA2_/MRDRNA2_81738_c0_seq1.p1  ORF type:complete len:534 (+),score=100.96 gnl/MRDRNA2_/MRDRNA2_81738_c0_seq1:120-1604(+)